MVEVISRPPWMIRCIAGADLPISSVASETVRSVKGKALASSAFGDPLQIRPPIPRAIVHSTGDDIANRPSMAGGSACGAFQLGVVAYCNWHFGSGFVSDRSIGFDSWLIVARCLGLIGLFGFDGRIDCSIFVRYITER